MVAEEPQKKRQGVGAWWGKAALSTILGTLLLYAGALGPITLLDRKGENRRVLKVIHSKSKMVHR